MDIVFKKDSLNENKPKISFKDKVVGFFKRYDSNFYFFLMLCVMGVAFFAASLFKNQWTTLFGGDYTAQQLSFYTNGYDDWWHFFKTGQFRFFDTNTYLGASNIGANSFYYFFDPFFFPILLCPRAYIAQGMAFLAIFKIATAGMFFTKYMSVMGASKQASRVTGMAYAFCGWMAWFLWFNHMTEVMIVFPIMLWGVERILRDKKPWLLMFGIFLMGVTNYFFLIGMGIACFFYAIYRYFQRLKLNTLEDNFKILGIGVVGFAGGLLLSCCVVIPAALYSLDAPRAANSGYLDDIKIALQNKQIDRAIRLLFSWKECAGAEYRHFYPLINLVYPCASCRGTPLTQYGNEWYDNCATNIYVYIPMLLMFIPAYIKAMKEHKWSYIVATVLFLVALETPFAYYMFFGFTAPYGRWELFFITSFLTFTGLYLDHLKEQPVWTDIVSYVFVIVLAIVGAIFANTIVTKYSSEGFTERGDGYISLGGACAILCIYTTIAFIVILFLKKKANFTRTIGFFITIEAVVMGFLTIEGHWCGSFVDANNGLQYNTDIYQLNRQIAAKDKSYYRVWTYNQNEGARNDGMRNDYNGLGCFHSLYNFNLNNFLNWTKIQDGDTFLGSGSWAGSYVWKNADLDKFLGVKYYFIQGNYPQYGWLNDGHVVDEDHPFQYNVPLDYELINDYKTDNYKVFEDKKTINFAFGFDNIITYETMDNGVQASKQDFPYNASYEVLRNDEMLLEGAILDVKTAEKVTNNGTFSVKKGINDRYLNKIELKRTYKTNVKMYDLHATTDGSKYTVNTFFEDYAQAYLGAHALTSDMLVNIDNGTFGEVISADSANTEYGRYVTLIERKNNDAFDDFYDPMGYSVYVPYYYYDEYRADIYLVDEDNKIITWDRHQDDKYQCGGNKYRGLYVHARELNPDGTVKVAAPKLKKIIVAQRHNKYVPKSLFENIYAESYTQQQTRYANLNQYKVTDVVYKEDASFKFKTNFDKSIVVVTQMPFEKGWTVKAKDSTGKTKKLEVFSAQGGFASFVAPEGEYTYSMSFYPSTLPLGQLLSAAGALLFIGTFAVYKFFIEDKEDKKSEAIERSTSY